MPGKVIFTVLDEVSTKIFSPAKTVPVVADIVLHVEEDVSSGYQLVPSVAQNIF